MSTEEYAYWSLSILLWSFLVSRSTSISTQKRWRWSVGWGHIILFGYVQSLGYCSQFYWGLCFFYQWCHQSTSSNHQEVYLSKTFAVRFSSTNYDALRANTQNWPIINASIAPPANHLHLSTVTKLSSSKNFILLGQESRSSRKSSYNGLSVHVQLAIYVPFTRRRSW